MRNLTQVSMPATTKFLLEIKLEEGDMSDKQTNLLLGKYIDDGFHLKENGHQVVEIYFKDAYIDELDRWDLTPESVQQVCQNYWDSILTVSSFF